MSFLSFTIRILPPSHCAGCEWLCGAWLQAGAAGWAKPQHNVSHFSAWKKSFTYPHKSYKHSSVNWKAVSVSVPNASLAQENTWIFSICNYMLFSGIFSREEVQKGSQEEGLKIANAPKTVLIKQQTSCWFFSLCFYLSYNLSALPINIHLGSSARCIARLWGTSFQSSQR